MASLLFSPLSLGPKVARNRIMRLPTISNLGEKSSVSDAMVAHVARISRGGVGTVVTEGMAVHPSSVRGDKLVAAFRPEAVPGLRRLGEAVHAGGALCIAQLLHGGRQHHSSRGLPLLWAPSPVACDYSGGVAHEITREEIGDLIQGFVSAASHVMQAGFDGVEVHGAQGYLLQQFMSPLSNRREDEFGGGFENRMRFPMLVLAAVRTAVGPSGIVGYRLGVEEFSDGGLTLDDACRAAEMLSATGQIDYFSLSQGNFTSIEQHLPDRHQAPGAFTDLHATVKRHVGRIPTVTCGRFIDAAMAEQTLADDKADIIGMSRALTADPDWPRKSAGELSGDIIPCIACNQCWVSSMTGEKIRCVVNPSVGSELTAARPAAATRRHVLVVGGGPAGLEAARTAAERGARVTLMEAGDRLGGRLLAAADLPFQRELSDFAIYLARQAERSGAHIRLNSLATIDSIDAEGADAVILALGTQQVAPAVPSDGSIKIVTEDRIAFPAGGTPHVIVVDEDGHNWSAAAAEFLALNGCEVTVVTPFFEVFREISSVSRGHVIAVLDRHRVRIVANTRLVRVQDGAAILRNKFSGREENLTAAAIHWIGSLRARDDLAKALSPRHANIHVIGDAVAPRRLVDAIAEGRHAGILVTS